jgi:hypothetical protein
MKALTEDKSFNDYSFLEMNAAGQFVDGKKVITARHLTKHFKTRMQIKPGTTDVFIWVHGWRNKRKHAISNSRTLFPAILDVQQRKKKLYRRIKQFQPQFVSVHWPSDSTVLFGGYQKIRDRAAKMTDSGEAEYFLARLLGYLEDLNSEAPPDNRKLLAARDGFFVHCIGHSFGGRFLTAAVRASAHPTPKTKKLSARRPKFAYTIDSFLIFQMAAPAASFGGELEQLATEAPIAEGSGRIVLTHSSRDAANCGWHRKMEGEEAIGCHGALEPSKLISSCTFRKLDQTYTARDFRKRIVNVDASRAFTKGSQLGAGAHSDYWYEDSVHLILTLADRARA